MQPSAVHHPKATCKCCDQTASICSYVDFNKSCEDPKQPVFEPSGVPVPYYRCPGCGFIFTTFFDGFTAADFKAYIYNEDYHLLDPDFAINRPRATADTVERLLFQHRDKVRVLDYGGGEGTMVRLLRERGFIVADSYDPFFQEQRPEGKYDFISCIEVVEHTHDPVGTFTDMFSFLDPAQGAILFSTLLQPDNIRDIGLNWWYAAPRNGHISLFTRPALAQLAQKLGAHVVSFNDSLYLMFRQFPAFLAHLIKVA